MSDQPIAEGDLLAYLDGADLPHVAAALRASPELQQELETLHRAQQVLQRVFGAPPLPEPQDWVDVATDQATPAQHARVQSYLHAHPASAARLHALQAEALAADGEWAQAAQREQDAAPPMPHPVPARLHLPVYIATRVVGAVGLRGAATEQAFAGAELDAQVIVRIVPPTRERWHLEGYVTQQQQPAVGVTVKLSAAHARPRPRVTDAAGFFTFRRLAAGSYRLQVRFAQGLLLLPELVLHDD